MIFCNSEIKVGDAVSTVCVKLQGTNVTKTIQNYEISSIDEKLIRMKKKNKEGKLEDREDIVERKGFDIPNVKPVSINFMMSFCLVHSVHAEEAKNALVDACIQKFEQDEEEMKKALEAIAISKNVLLAAKN